MKHAEWETKTAKPPLRVLVKSPPLLFAQPTDGTGCACTVTANKGCAHEQRQAPARCETASPVTESLLAARNRIRMSGGAFRWRGGGDKPTNMTRTRRLDSGARGPENCMVFYTEYPAAPGYGSEFSSLHDTCLRVVGRRCSSGDRLPPQHLVWPAPESWLLRLRREPQHRPSRWLLAQLQLAV